ncbi:MAG: hypothetical protein AB7P08_06275 [Burkholderiales bacterium]
MKVYGNDVLVLRNKKIPVKLAEVPQADLKFYLENPRLYTLVRRDGQEPTQEEIAKELSKMEHVKQLVQAIKQHGGLMDAVIVQGSTNVVLEGNSRLAAYRILAGQDPVKWGMVRARILPDTISESEVFSLLGEYHIIGKKDWAPFEQAGYLYRRHKTHKVPIEALALEINIGRKLISHLIGVYQFMLDNNERDVNRWSYYDEYLKSNKIKRARKQFPELDDVVVRKIRSEEIERAVDVRDGLRKIVEAGGHVLERFATEKRDFTQSVNAALNKGAGDHGVQKVKRFKEWLAVPDNQHELDGLTGGARKECQYDLEKIGKLIERVLKRFNTPR